MALVEIAREGDFAIVTIDNPPVNALSIALRAELHAAVRGITADRAIRGVVLTGAGASFIAGADIRELGQARTEPTLLQVTDEIEASKVPWVAAIGGAALGGGLELAMACHGRVATEGSRLGLPEVSLGIIAGAGGTVRLPRLVPVRQGVAMATSGKPVTAAEALEMGLIDRLAAGNPLQAAKELLAELAGGKGFARVLDRPVRKPLADEEFDRLLGEVRRKAKGQAAPAEALEAIRDSQGLPARNALDRARARFLRLVDSEQSRALRHVFLAERGAGARLRCLEARPVSLSRVGVIGGGTMGAGIAAALLLAGSEVTLVERDAAVAETARGRVAAILADSAKRGVIAAADAVLRRLAAGSSWEGLAGCPLVIEAVFEDMEVKAEVFRKLDALMPPDAILATNTSYLDVDRIAETTRHPERILGLHFFSPAHVMKLIEVVRGRHTGDAALATGGALARHLRKTAIVAGVCDGFIGNRIMSAYRRECDFMLEEGALPQEIDGAMRDFGFAMGIYEIQDMSGLDIAWAMRKRRAPQWPPEERYSRIADLLCEAGRLGRKTGKGWYDHAGGKAEPDPEVERLIVAESERLGHARRKFVGTEITGRILDVMQTEAGKLLSEGIAETAADIDVTMILGFGFPRFRGGPMFLADRKG